MSPSPVAVAPDAPPALLDIPFERSLNRSGRQVVAIVTLTTAAVLLAGALAAFVGGVAGAVVVPLAVFACVLSSLRLMQHRQRRAADAIDLAGAPDVRTAVAAVLPRIRGVSVQAGLAHVARRLASGGHAGTVIRIAPPSHAGTVQPLALPFEPQPLNEALSPLVAAGATDASLSSDALERATSAADALRLRATLRRNILLKGGWFLVILFGANALMSIVSAILHRRIDVSTVAWPAALAALLFIPVGQPWFRSRTLLAVPGGLVRRTSGWRQQTCTLHLYDRRRSTLIVSWLNGERWGASVSDGSECDSMTGTKAEVGFLLRAWLSPLEPPRIEQLSDLA